MGHKKLKRFEAIKGFNNVFQYPEGMKGRWHEEFKNKNPLVLELACGKGEYTIGLAERYPDKNFMGVDLKGNRIWKGASYAIKNNLKNAFFLRTQIEMIDNYFAEDEVDEIWITFPDPQLRLSRAKKRLTHPAFLMKYEKFLKRGGRIHLKTDSPSLYGFTKEVISWCGLELIKDMPDVYSLPDIPEDVKIKTYYESLDIARSKKVFYLCWSIPEEWNRNAKAFTDYFKTKMSSIETE